MTRSTVYDIKLPAAPKQVSPLIRASRWGLFTIGIVYGVFHFRYLKAREPAIVERNNQIIAKQKAAQVIAAERELSELAKEISVEF